jgi:toxin-antitoxin system PIN domain toxin
MLLDADLLLYAVHRTSAFHDAARAWLTEQLNGPRRVGVPWQSLGAFLRIATHPRAFERPLSAQDAWARVDDWLSARPVWVPVPGDRHASILGKLVVDHDVRGNLMPDAQLAALALEHGLTVCSTDTDFARFTEVRWTNPLSVS